MKPTFQFSDYIGRASVFAPRPASRSLQIEYNFQAGVGNFSGKGKPFPPFHRMSEDYINGESRVQFATEAAVFGLIVLTAAIPVIESIQGLFRLVYATF